MQEEEEMTGFGDDLIQSLNEALARGRKWAKLTQVRTGPR